MGAQLNIKDAKIATDARALAERLGKSVTATIGEAISEKAAREAAMDLDVQALLAKARSLRQHWKPRFRDQDLSLTHGTLLYDEAGAPE